MRYDACSLRMMRSLMIELVHEEEAALRRATRDAERYEGVELGSPFLAIAAHATASLPRLEELAAARRAGPRRTLHVLRRWLGRAKDLYRERFVTAERAYRKTISRIRHGIDLVRLIRVTAESARDDELEAFCNDWMRVRGALVADLVQQIEWFGDRPRVSMESAHAIGGARRQMAFVRRLASQRAVAPRSTGYRRLLEGASSPTGASASNLQ